MKKLVLNLTIMIATFNGITIGQSFEESNPYAFNAKTDAVKEFTQHELVSKRKYMVLRIKIIKIRKNSGEFVLSFISNFSSYDRLNPSHYLFLDNKLVLIKTDSTLFDILDDYGIQPTSDSIKIAAGKHLAGPHPTIPGLHMSITGQISPMMIVTYRRNRVKKMFFDGRDLPERKFWF